MKSDEYKTNLRKLVSYIKGNRKSIISDLKNDMKIYASSHDYENAAVVRNKIYNLNELQQRIMFGDKEFIDISKDHALNDLTELFGLPKIPTRIEGFDISHTSGTNVVASMVVFKNGASDRSSYRKFKTLFDKNDDFYNMKEIITRRFSQKNIKNWGKPDLVIIDGGKGQLSIVNQSLNESSWDGITCIGLAKRDEQIVTQNIKINQEKLAELGGYITKSDGFNLINIPKSTHIIKLLQRIRDESHRFAVNYHTVLKRKKQTVGLLDGIPGIGPKTRSKLIRKFGSITGLKNASESSITSLIGAVKAKTLFFYIKEL